MSNKKVAVITASLSKKTLEKTILSVRNQTYQNIQHYVVLDGVHNQEFIDYLKLTYPEVIFLQIPFQVGSKITVNGPVIGIALYYVSEEYICFLDDDNWYLPNHIEELLKCFSVSGIKFAYSLRYLYTNENDYLTKDNFNSLGLFTISLSTMYNNSYYTSHKALFADTNCIMFNRDILNRYGNRWNSGISNDKDFFKALIDNSENGIANALYTVCYVISGFDIKQNSKEENLKNQAYVYKNLSEQSSDLYHGQYWNLPHIYYGGKVRNLEEFFSEHEEERQKYKDFRI